MSVQVERSVKFFKVIVAIVTSAIAILILSILQDRAEAKTTNMSDFLNTAHADAPSSCGTTESCVSCAVCDYSQCISCNTPPSTGGDAQGGGDDGDDGC